MSYSFFNLADPDSHVCETHAAVADAQHRVFLASLSPAEADTLCRDTCDLANVLYRAIYTHGDDAGISYGAIVEALRLVRARIEQDMDTPAADDCDA